MIKNLIICLVKNLMIFLIDFYRITFSIFLSPCCRFEPSCSFYAQESLKKFGIKIGLTLAIKRVLKCHPFHPGGYDPLPPNNIYFKNSKQKDEE